ncbi:hypothetical protein, partial [Wolbachia endosymbiont of Drosophila burlai]|uniref:hypothetical protein n=1 Tax=Wolbachia endosymbiont of Drosophila burlai TaxID=3002577 RepID=UPI00397CEECC
MNLSNFFGLNLPGSPGSLPGKDNQERTPLHLSIQIGRTDVVNTLIDKKAEINAK